MKVREIISNELPEQSGEVVLLDVSYLEVQDSINTRGTSFWKGSRKIFFTSYEEFKEYTNKQKFHVTTRSKRKREDETYDDDEDEYDDEYDSSYINHINRSSN